MLCGYTTGKEVKQAHSRGVFDDAHPGAEAPEQVMGGGITDDEISIRISHNLYLLFYECECYRQVNTQ